MYGRLSIHSTAVAGALFPGERGAFFIFLLLLFSLLFSETTESGNVFTFSDSVYTCSVDLGSLKKQKITRYVNNSPENKKKDALMYLLDSLGYFNLRIDTLARDSLVITIGSRAAIDTVIINSNYPLNIDSIRQIRFPIPYDAGLIRALARKTVIHLTRKGFPFANTSLTISDSQHGRHDTTSISQPRKHLTIQFTVHTGKKCVFSSPLFLGVFQTKETLLAQDILFTRGQIFDARKIETSQKRLLTRSYIANVRPETPGIVIPAEKNDSIDNRENTIESTGSDSLATVAVPFYIEDNSGMGIDGAVAYNSDAAVRWSGILTLTLLNVFHRGESASLFYRGEKLLQQFDVAIAVPYPFLWPIFLSGAFGLEIEEKNYGYLHGEFTVLTQLKELWQAGLAVNGHETTINDQNASWHFIGIDLVLQRTREPYRDGILTREFLLRTGAGIADKADGRYNRWRIDFSVGSHIPLFSHQAFLGKLATHIITSEDKDSLHLTEKVRIGGYNNIRGYTDNQFPFIAVGYAQTAYLYYFNPTGSVYIFMDGGVGFSENISLNRSDRTVLFGYGLGIRVPVKIGTLSLEWARNYKENKGLGRIHVRITNSVSQGMQ